MSAAKMYASMVINGQEGWGDGFTSLFFCEAIQKFTPGQFEFYVYDGPAMGTGHTDSTFRHRNYIKQPEFVAGWLDGPPKSSDFEWCMATHYSHPPKQGKLAPEHFHLDRGGVSGYLPPMVLDSDIKIFRLHSDKEISVLANNGFIATAEVLDPPELPDEYVVLQMRREDATAVGKKPSRNRHEGPEFDHWQSAFVSDLKLPIVFIAGATVPDGAIDARAWTLWQKIHAAQHAQKVYVHHSGFGMVLAMYAGRKKTEVVNVSPDAGLRNPSLSVFGNVDWVFRDVRGPTVLAEYTVRH